MHCSPLHAAGSSSRTKASRINCSNYSRIKTGNCPSLHQGRGRAAASAPLRNGAGANNSPQLIPERGCLGEFLLEMQSLCEHFTFLGCKHCTWGLCLCVTSVLTNVFRVQGHQAAPTCCPTTTTKRRGGKNIHVLLIAFIALDRSGYHWHFTWDLST